MKKLSYIILLLLSSFLIISCNYEERVYDGEALLHFNDKTSTDVIITSGDVQKDLVITYGTLAQISGTHQVKLVLDTEKSTAVEGKDFVILNNGTDELTAGELGGSFTVRVLESGASQTAKTAVFKLQSSTLPNAVFNQEYSMGSSLTCPISTFIGNTQFAYTGWWQAAGTYNIVAHPTEVNTLLIKDFGDPGVDMKIVYNPETGVVTVPDQSTGYSIAQGPVWARNSTDTNQVSFYNACTRTLKLYVNYYIKGTNLAYGNKVEDFKGK